MLSKLFWLTVKSDAHLRRLRRRLTLVYALAMLIGLFGFSKFLLASYLEAQENEVAAELLLSANQAARSVGYGSDDSIEVSGYFERELDQEYPQLWILGWDEESEEGYGVYAGPQEDFFPNVYLYEDLDPILTGDNLAMYSIWSYEDDDVGAYARGVPISYPDGELGYVAAVAVIDPEALRTGYDDFRRKVMLSSLGLLLGSAAVGYVMAGRSMRPAQKSLEQQERLIADAAHELRTPVARIKAVAEGGVAGDEPPKAALERVVRVADSASGLVDDLMVLARMDAGKEQLVTEKFRLDLLVETIADDYDGIAIEAVPTVMDGDPNLIKRAVGNLVGNAVKHGRANDPEAAIEITVFPTQVIVKDGGPGIDPKLGDRLYERFQSGSDSSGHGLGLAIVKWIAEAHEGTLEIVPADVGGTKACLVF